MELGDPDSVFLNGGEFNFRVPGLPLRANPNVGLERAKGLVEVDVRLKSRGLLLTVVTFLLLPPLSLLVSSLPSLSLLCCACVCELRRLTSHSRDLVLSALFGMISLGFSTLTVSMAFPD